MAGRFSRPLATAGAFALAMNFEGVGRIAFLPMDIDAVG
jgi:hypothetical protein